MLIEILERTNKESHKFFFKKYIHVAKYNNWEEKYVLSIKKYQIAFAYFNRNSESAMTT